MPLFIKVKIIYLFHEHLKYFEPVFQKQYIIYQLPMPINKDALVRYRVINKCLLSKANKFPNKDELRNSCIEALGVNSISNRTIEKDLEDMRYNEELGFHAPIEYNKKMKGYWYTEPEYSIDKIPLKDDDLNALQFAASILSQFSHLSILNDFAGTVSKIMEAVNINRIVAENSELEFIEFDNADHIPGGPFLETIVNAIKTNVCISFEYKKHGTENSKSYFMEPYLLKQFKNIWYVIGREPSSNKIKTFGLDRIVAIETSKDAFTLQAGFDRKKYFRNAFGITSFHAEPEEVLLSFSKKTADYIKALPLHHSQKIISENENNTTFSLMVYPTYDLLMQLLSYGAELKVIKPERLRNEMVSILKSTLDQYSK